MPVREKVTIKSSDKVMFVVELNFLRQCKLFDGMLASGSIPEVIPLVIHSSILCKIIDFLNHYSEETDDAQNGVDSAAPNWCTQFLEANYIILQNLYEAANYLGVHRLSTSCRSKIEECMEPTPCSSRNADTVNLYGGRNNMRVDLLRRYRNRQGNGSPRSTFRNPLLNSRRIARYRLAADRERPGSVHTTNTSDDSTATSPHDSNKSTHAEDAYTLGLIRSMIEAAEKSTTDFLQQSITINPCQITTQDFDAPSTSQGVRHVSNDLEEGSNNQVRSEAGGVEVESTATIRAKEEQGGLTTQLQFEAAMSRARRNLLIEDCLEFEEQNAICISRMSPFVRMKNEENQSHNNITAFKLKPSKPVKEDKAEETTNEETENMFMRMIKEANNPAALGDLI